MLTSCAAAQACARFRRRAGKPVGGARVEHRTFLAVDIAEQRRDMETVPGRIYQGLLRLLQVRGHNHAFARGDTELLDTGKPTWMVDVQRSQGAPHRLVAGEP